jgi:hypothetical protein
MSPMTPNAEYQMAARECVEKLRRLNLQETSCGLFALEDQDRTFGWWLGELQARITCLSVLQEPSLEVLDSLGAHVLALKVRIARMQETQVHTGEAA